MSVIASAECGAEQILQLSPEKLMLVAIVRSAHTKQTTLMSTGSTYLASKDFKVSTGVFICDSGLSFYKEQISNRLLSLILDPGIWSYKAGLLERCLVSII